MAPHECGNCREGDWFHERGGWICASVLSRRQAAELFPSETTIRYADESGTEHEASIETFVESQLTDPREDDFGVLVQDLEGFVTVPSIDDDGRHVTRQVEAVSKHPRLTI